MVQALIKTANSLILNFVGGITKKVDSPALIEKVLNAYKAGASDQQILEIIDLTLLIKKHPSGLFGVKDGLVYVDEEAVPDALSSRIIDFANNGLPFEPLIKFWNNCKLNPDSRAKTDLYRFLEHNGIPITNDGNFIAYRAVRNDFKDKYTGKIDNSVGQIVKMDRNLVNSDPTVTCSNGLHVAAYNYARSVYGSISGLATDDVLIEVKVNPRFVVCVPLDYNNQKMRVCEYEVIAVNVDGVITRPCYDPENIISDQPCDEGDQWSDDGDYENNAQTLYSNNNWKTQKRDSKGRFLPKV